MTVMLPGPSRLAAAVAAAVEVHPYAARGALELSSRVEMDASQMWTQLLSLSGGELDAAIEALHILQVRVLIATARPRIGIAGVLTVLARLLDKHRPENVEALAWDVFLESDGHPAFRALSAEHARVHAAEHPLWPHMVQKVRPSEVVLVRYHQQPQPFDQWIASREVALEGHQSFVRTLVRTLLSPGELVRLDQRENSRAIQNWVQRAIPLEGQETWYRAFLEETVRAKRPVDHAVLRAILERFGEPANARPFWDAISEEARRSFELWFTNARLTQLLGEGERVDFWRRFLPQIRRPFHNSDRKVVFIDLGVATAVQFVESGTATYLFRPDVFRRIYRGVEADVRRSVYDNAHKASGSYEHRGYAWRYRAESTVRQVLTELAYE